MSFNSSTSMLRGPHMAWWWYALFLTLLAAILGREMGEQQRLVEQSESERLQGQVAAIQDDVAEHLVQTAKTLNALTAHFSKVDASARLDPAGDFAIAEAALRGVHGIFILDAQGAPVARSQILPGDYKSSVEQAFVRARNTGRPGVLTILPPVRTADGAMVMILALPRADRHGKFAGIVGAAIDPSCCKSLMEAMHLSPDHFMSIAHGDGLVFLFSPHQPGLDGRNLDVPGSLFRRHKESGQAVSVLTGMNQALQAEQIVALRTVRPAGLELAAPLVVAAGRNTSSVFAQWRRDAWQDAALFLVLALILAIGLAFFQRGQRAMQAEANAAAAAENLADERTRLAVEGAELGVWDCNLLHQDITADAGMAVILGLEGAGPVAMETLRKIVIVEDLAILDAALSPPEGQTFDFGTLRILRPDGTRRVVRIRARRFFAGHGQGVRIIGTIQDVTVQAGASARLAASEARLKAVFDLIPVGITVTDASGHIVDVNAASEKLLGITRQEHLTRSYAGKEWTIRHPDGRIMGSVDYPAFRALQGRQAVFDVEMRVDIPGGERWLSVSAVPVFSNESGQATGSAELTGVVLAYVDVSEARRAGQMLRKLTRALDQSGAAVLITDVQGVIEYVNDAAVSTFGYPKEEMIGQTPRLIRSGVTPGEVYHRQKSDMLAGRAWRGELVNRKRDGSMIHQLVSISPVRDAFDRVSNFVAIYEDLSDRVETERLRVDFEKRLSRVERMEVLGAMAGGVAHDFNNILVAVLGYSGLGKLAMSSLGGPPKIVSYFEEIEIAGQRARQLVQQLLAFSRGGTIKPSRVILADAAQEAVSLLRASFPDGIRIVSEIEADLPEIEIDPTQLFRLFANPMRNARDAMGDEGEIRLSIRRVSSADLLHCDSCHEEFSGDHLLISVADQGCGVPEHLRGRIFEPFYSTWHVADGAGMGLAVVHGVMHTNGGHVRVVARPEGGTELMMYLPAHLFSEVAVNAPDSPVDGGG